MGGKSSKGQVLSTDPPPPEPKEPPYAGPAAKYHFINCQVAIQHQVNFGFMSQPVTTSNVDSYYPLLAEQYAKGMKLLTFYRIPAQVQHGGGFFNPKVLVPFQGIYCSYPTHPERPAELRIEKSVIQPEVVFHSFITTQQNVVTNTQHLFQTLGHYADMGARLICIEITGQEHVSPAAIHTRMPALGCDLFFEMPCGAFEEKYIYTVECVPVGVTVEPGFTAKVQAHCDWIGTFSKYLNQGWKLVEIFYDKTRRAQTAGFTSHGQINCQWYFEKPASRANDSFPLYEGTIVEHEIHSNTMHTKTDWEPIIQEKGNNGWELACILETPDVRYSIGFTNKVHIKTLLFFQRKIITCSPEPPPIAAGVPAPMPYVNPPPYPADGSQNAWKPSEDLKQ